MLVVMKAQATEDEIRSVCQKIEELGYRAHSMPGAQRTAIGITGNRGEVEPGTLDEMPGVQELIRVSKPYKLVSRDVKAENTVITFAGTDATFGGPGLAVIAGPCAIENREQTMAVAEQVYRREPSSSAEERTNHVPRLIHFRAWGNRACRSWRKFAKNSV